jgi:uncharacterized protein (TIGR03437 family)
MNRPKILMFAIFAFLVLGCSDSARGQVSLTVTPQTLAFNNIPSNSLSAAQQVQVSANVATTVVIQVSGSAPWLTVDHTGPLNIGTTVTTLNVRANTSNLQAGSYAGTFLISAGQSQVTVNVSLSVTGSSVLSANPSSLTFSASQGAQSGTPSTTNVKVASSGATLQYNLQGSTVDGHSWLLLSTTSGTTGDAGFNVSVNPSTLTAGSYSATITAMSTSTGDSVQVSVSLAVTSNATLSVSPSTLSPFLYQTGGTVPTSQQLTVSAAGGTSQFSVRESPAVSWLVVSPLSGSAGTSPATLSLSVTPTGLQAQTYTTSVIVTPNGGADLAAVPVTLVVSANPLLQLSKTALSFSAQFASTLSPADQTVTVTASNSGAVAFSATSDQSWLTATASVSTTPSVLTVHINPGGLAINTYTGNITVRPSNGDQYTETIAVSLVVTSSSQLTAGPPDLLFSYQTGQTAPGSQTVQIQSVGQPVSFTIATATSTCGSNWLTASSNSSSTPATLTVAVVTTGMSPGTCSGTVNLNYNNGSGAATLPIMVTLAVSNTSELSVSMPLGFGIQTVQQGAVSFTASISLTSTDPNTPVSFTASAVSTGGTWLLVGPGTGTTPQNLLVQFLPGSLQAGQYSGSIFINSASLGSTQLTIPVSLTVTSNVTVSISPTSLTFTEAQGGSAAAAGLSAQTLFFTSSGGTATFTASIASITGGSNWLQISPTSGQATGGIQVSVLPNSLSQGTYTAQILVAFQGSATAPITVPVTLNVTGPQTVSATPTSLSFSYPFGTAQPSPQQIAVTGTNGAVAFSVGVTSSGWLSVDATSGTTPKNLNVSVNPTGLQIGSYTGTISISAAGVLATPIAITVSLTVTSTPPPQPIRIYNAASGAAGAIAPGEIITIGGNQLGPATPAGGVSFQVSSSGTVASTLAGVQVLFDGNPGTPTFVSASQINVVVPYEIAGRVSTNITVSYNGMASTPIQQLLASYAPSLFTSSFTGSGQVAAINQNGTINGTGSGFAPAPQGSVIQLYGTGGGQTSPASLTGTITPIPTSPAGLYKVQGGVTATVGGQAAAVNFAGSAPGLITGAIQFNVTIPTGVNGIVPVVITINGVSSPVGTTIAVQ